MFVSCIAAVRGWRSVARRRGPRNSRAGACARCQQRYACRNGQRSVAGYLLADALPLLPLTRTAAAGGRSVA
jgi:hypothetical protein